MTMTRSKATTQALTVFSAGPRPAGAAGGSAAAAAAPARTRVSTARNKGLRLRAGARRIAASLENRSAVSGRCVGNAARRPGPGGHKCHFRKTMIRISLPVLQRKPLTALTAIGAGWRRCGGAARPRAAPGGAVEEGEAAQLLGAVPGRRQVLLDQLLAVPPAGEEPAHRRREGRLELGAAPRGEEQAGDVVPVAEAPQEL